MTTKPENPWRAPWKACRWYEGHGFTGNPEDYGYEPGDELPAITHIEDCDGKNVASAHDLFTFDDAKANLMAASPDMFGALGVLVWQLDRMDDLPEEVEAMIADAKAALARARGEA